MLADAGLRPPRRQGRLRALPGVLGPVGVGARSSSATVARWATIVLVGSRRLARRRCRLAADAASSPRTSRCAGACSSSSRGCSTATTATSATTRPTRCTRSAVVDGAVVGAVRLYPLDARRAVEGRPARRAARGARARASARCSCASPSRTAGELRRPRGWSRRSSCRTCASSSASAGASTARRRRTTASCTSRWRSRSGQPVSGVRGEVPDRRRRAAGRQPQHARCRRTRRTARRPARGARTPRTRRRRAAGARRAGSRSSGTSAASARARRRPGAGGASRSSVAPQPAPSIICSSEPAMPGIETSRAAWQSPASATSTSASPSSRRRSGARSRSEVKKACVVAHVPAVERERGEQHVAGLGRRARAAAACATPVQEADSAGGVAERQVAADDRHAEQPGGPGDAVEHALGVRCVRARRACRRAPAAGRPSRARRRRSSRPRRRRRRTGRPRTNGGEIASPQTTR